MRGTESSLQPQPERAFFIFLFGHRVGSGGSRLYRLDELEIRNSPAQPSLTLFRDIYHVFSKRGRYHPKPMRDF
jgi:hypothetical protein